jgi:hypothetical protein
VLNLETASVRSIPLSHVHLLGLDPKQKDDLRLKKRLSRPDHPMARVYTLPISFMSVRACVCVD